MPWIGAKRMKQIYDTSSPVQPVAKPSHPVSQLYSYRRVNWVTDLREGIKGFINRTGAESPWVSRSKSCSRQPVK